MHDAHAGRNIHALDPYRMPSASAEARGAAAGAAILDAHRAANAGALPETVAVNLWGLDSIKTRGDNVGLVLWLVGARPVKEATGRIARFELIPLEELGRPRIDVLCNMSGIFRCVPRRQRVSCLAGTHGKGYCDVPVTTRVVTGEPAVYTRLPSRLLQCPARTFSVFAGERQELPGHA